MPSQARKLRLRKRRAMPKVPMVSQKDYNPGPCSKIALVRAFSTAEAVANLKLLTQLGLFKPLRDTKF